MSLLKGIWRPEEPPRKGPNPHGDSVLTERLAELLGRQVEELQEKTPNEPENLTATATEESEGAGRSSEEQTDGTEMQSAPVMEPQAPSTGQRKSPKRSAPNGGSGSIARATEEALGQLRSTQEEIETSLRSRVHDYERELEATLNSSGRDTSGAGKSTEQAAQEIRSEARSWFEEARRELREQLDASRASIENQLKAHHTELLQAAQQKIEAMTQTSLQSQAQGSQRSTQEQVERWLKEQGDLSRSQTEAGAQELAKAVDQALAKLHAAEERIEANFRSQVEEYRRTVESATVELERKGISQAQFQSAAEELQRMTEQVLDRSTKKLEERTQEAIGQITEKLAAAQQTLGAAARAAMQGAVEEQQRRVTETWQQRTSAAVEAVTQAGEQTRTQFEAARKAAEEKFQQAAQDQSRRVAEQITNELERGEARTRLTHWIEEQNEAARRQTSDAQRKMEETASQAAARLGTISRETEAALETRLREQQQRWLDSALETARQSGFERKVVEQALTELEKTTSQFLEQSTKRLTEQAATAREEIAKEMEGASRKLLEGVEASLENISWQHRGRLAQWWEERAQTARREAETASQSISQAAQQAASQLRTAQNEIESEMKNRARDHQVRLLDSAMEEMRSSGAIDRAVSEASTALRTNASETLSRSTQQLRDQMEATRKGIENQALAARREVAEDLARKVEQAQTSVENASKALTEDYRRQLSVWWEERTQSSQRESEEATRTISRSAKQASEQLQTIQKEIATELQSGMENYRRGLREAAADELRRQGFQKDMLDTIAGELTKTAQDLAARSTTELQRHIEKTLSTLEQKAETSRQAFLDDSQKKLGEMVRASMNDATTRFHELLSKNAQDLEHEQEEWLQRKREAVWLDINKHAPAGSGQRSHSEASAKEHRAKAASAGMLGRLIVVMLVIAVAAGLTAAFIKLVPQPSIEMELQADPPAEFVLENPRWGAQERARQLRLAHAYWMLAINDLQHKYPYDKPLPVTPPPDFQVNQPGLKDDLASRARYWGELQKIWLTSSDWRKTTTGGNSLSSVLGWIEQKFSQASTPSNSTNN